MEMRTVSPLAGNAPNRQEFVDLQASVKEYVLGMRQELFDAVKRQDQRIDGLYGMNIKDMRVRIETLESTATLTPPAAVAASEGVRNDLAHTQAELLNLTAKLDVYDHSLQGIILETRGAVERLALLEAKFQSTSQENFEGIRVELDTLQKTVRGVEKTIGVDKRAELNLDPSDRWQRRGSAPLDHQYFATKHARPRPFRMVVRRGAKLWRPHYPFQNSVCEVHQRQHTSHLPLSWMTPTAVSVARRT